MLKLKGQMSTALSLSLLASALFFIILPYSSSLRPAYIHLLFNLLVVALGSAESGILTVFSKSTCDDVHQPTLVDDAIESPAAGEFTEMGCEDRAQRSGKKSINEVICSPARLLCKNCEDDETALLTGGITDEDGEVDAEEISELELFIRAEEFIENFYKELKMQREEEESWIKRQHFSKEASSNKLSL